MNNRFWKSVAALSLVLAIAALCWNFTGRRLFDWLTPDQKIIRTANAVLLKIERDNSLVTTKAYVQAIVRQRDERWYGDAELIRIVPATIHYAINLGEIDRSQLRYENGVLLIPLPDVKIQAIDPDLAKAELLRNLDFLRTEKYTGNILEETTEKMVRPTLEEMGKSPDIYRVAKEQAIASIKQLFEAAFGAAGIPVQVKPYFKSDGPIMKKAG